MDDANNEAAGWLDLNNDGLYETRVDADGNGTLDDDVVNVSPATLLSKWSNFLTGFDSSGNDLSLKNHGRFEQDAPTDRNGVNMRDYAFNGGYVESAVLHHNCLNNQDAN